jgi:tripartite ATP-independent transporter DctP family solute receptor
MMRMVLAAFLLLLVVPASAVAATVLTLAQVSVPEHPRARACRYFAEQVAARSDGRLLVDVVNRASLGDDVTLVNALLDGSLDLSANGQGPVSAVVPEINAFGLPFLFSAPEQAWRLLDGPLGEELAQRAAAKGLVVLGFWDNGIRHLSNALHPIRTPADMAGLRIRTPPADSVTVDIMTALGAQAQPIRFSDVYNALQRGVVDGQENPLINFQAARFDEVQGFISLTGHRYETTPFVMSRRSWDGLSPADQAVITAAAAEATRYQRQLTRAADDAAQADLIRRGVRIDAVDKAPFIAATAGIRDKWYASPIGDYVRAMVRAAQGDQ